MNYFTLYDGTDGASASKTSLEFGVGLSGTGVWDAPARKGESISIPGRNGNIWVDDGSWENILVTYPCWIAEGFDQKVDEFRGWLASHSDKYYRITDTYHPDEYRLGRFAGEFSATPGTRNKSGRFDVVFDCDPRRFYNDNITASSQWSTSYSTDSHFTINNTSIVGVYPVIELEFNLIQQIEPFAKTYTIEISIGQNKCIILSSPMDWHDPCIVYIDMETGGVFSDAALKKPYQVLQEDGENALVVYPAQLVPGENTINISITRLHDGPDRISGHIKVDAEVFGL